ncbi:hypothetical protein BT69DRAFT_287487 [Atractiella rhizophila]|nr:hypothetical protein BT69DRAFT_287487 [Atractiella rhizophila]
MTYDSARRTGRVSDAFDGKTVFVTGASGFLGQVMVHTLVNKFPRISTLYLHYAPSTPSPVIPTIPKTSSMKVHLIQSSLTVPDPHMTSLMRSQLSSSVQIVFALTGQIGLAPLLASFNRLQAVVWVGSCFSQTPSPTSGEWVEEELVDSSGERAVDKLRALNGLALEALSDEERKKVLGDHINPFSYYQSLTEVYLAQEFPNLPLSILRPSIISPSVATPYPGFVHGAPGLVTPVLAAGRGIVRSLPAAANSLATVVPVDWVVNACILLAWYEASHKKQKKSGIDVYNITGSRKTSEMTMCWRDLIGVFDHWIRSENWGENGVRKPRLRAVEPGSIEERWSETFDHKLFSNWNDFWKRQDKLHQFWLTHRSIFQDLELVTSISVEYVVEKLPRIQKLLSPEDRNAFPIDFIDEQNWREWARTFVQEVARRERGDNGVGGGARGSMYEKGVRRTEGGGLERVSPAVSPVVEKRASRGTIRSLKRRMSTIATLPSRISIASILTTPSVYTQAEENLALELEREKSVRKRSNTIAGETIPSLPSPDCQLAGFGEVDQQRYFRWDGGYAGR